MATEIQILIAGSALDLVIDEGKNFFLTKESYNLSDLESRDSDYTQTFNIPTTPTNLELLGVQAPLKARFSTQPTGFIDCQLLVNGVPLLQNAVILVGIQTGDNISITVFGGITRFYSALPDASIRDLDFSEYNLNWTLTNVFALKNTTEGICIPWNQWTGLESQRNYNAEGGTNQYYDDYEIGEGGFFIYLKTVLNKIFDSIGYTLDLSPIYADINSDKFDQAAMACPVDQLHDGRAQSFGEASEVRTNVPFAYPNGSTKVAFQAVVEDNNSWWVAIDNQYVIPGGIFGVDVEAAGRAANNSNELYLEVWRFVFPDASPTLLYSEQIVILSNKNWSIDLGAIVDVPNGGDLWLEINCVVGDTQIDSNSTFRVKQITQPIDLSVVVADNLPDITQKDFVKEVLKLYNLIPTQFDRTITFNYFENKDKATALQLDLDVSKDIKVLSGFPSYGRINNMKYTDANLERTDVNSSFPVNSLVINEEVDKVVSKFSASDIIEGGTNIITCPNYDIDYLYIGYLQPTAIGSGLCNLVESALTDIKAGDYVYMKEFNTSNLIYERARVLAVKDKQVLLDYEFPTLWIRGTQRVRFNKTELNTIRLARLETFIPLIDAEYVDGTESSGVGWSGKTATFDFMQWDYLKNDFYQIIIRSVEKPFIIQAWAFIDTERMIAVNGLRPTYIKEFDAYFYINKGEQWKTTGLARLELIKLDI